MHMGCQLGELGIYEVPCTCSCLEAWTMRYDRGSASFCEIGGTSGFLWSGAGGILRSSSSVELDKLTLTFVQIHTTCDHNHAYT
jgi:hypothetical protein